MLLLCIVFNICSVAYFLPPKKAVAYFFGASFPVDFIRVMHIGFLFEGGFLDLCSG